MPMRAVIPWAVGVCMLLAWLQPAKGGRAAAIDPPPTSRTKARRCMAGSYLSLYGDIGPMLVTDR